MSDLELCGSRPFVHTVRTDDTASNTTARPRSTPTAPTQERLPHRRPPGASIWAAASLPYCPLMPDSPVSTASGRQPWRQAVTFHADSRHRVMARASRRGWASGPCHRSSGPFIGAACRPWPAPRSIRSPEFSVKVSPNPQAHACPAFRCRTIVAGKTARRGHSMTPTGHAPTATIRSR